MSDRPLLQVLDIAAGYGRKQILFGVSLCVYPDEMIAIIGPNGAGKSTAIKAIMGYLKLWSGKIYFDGHEMDGLEPHRRIRLGIGYVPQGRTVFPGLTVQEHLDLGAWLLHSKDEKKEALERVYGLFPVWWERRRQLAGTMSGGERQLLSIARALMVKPRLLLLDEPSLGLAPRLVVTVFEKLEGINEQGIAVLVVEQNAATALSYAHRGYVPEMGANRIEGPGRALLQDPQVRAVYLGGSLYAPGQETCM